jgi:hypothetical protein
MPQDIISTPVNFVCLDKWSPQGPRQSRKSLSRTSGMDPEDWLVVHLTFDVLDTAVDKRRIYVGAGCIGCTDFLQLLV